MNPNLSAPSGPLFLGIEAGGTRTVALLADERGQCLQRVEAGPANLRLMSHRQLVQLLRGLAARLPRPSAVAIGMAGLHDEAERTRVRAALAQAWPGVASWAGNDLQTALAAAGGPLQPRHGARVIIISGTGSCCYGCNAAGATAKVGGWGHILGDRGSGYQVALGALRAIMLEFDHAGQWPPLGKRLLRALLLNRPSELVAWAQNAAKADLAAMAIEVFEAARQGDRTAQRIAQGAAETLAQDAAACARRLVAPNSAVEFLLTGSVLTKQPFFARAVRRRLKKLWPKATVQQLDREGAWGAVVYANEQWLKSVLERHSVGRARLPPSRRDDDNAMGLDGSGGASPHPARHSQTASPPLHGRTREIPASSRLSPTEERNPRSMNLDRLPLSQAIRLMLSEDARIPGALLREQSGIEQAIRLIVRSLRSGGRLFYVGAGTSGRLGVLDASECPPTFRTPPDQVQGIMAGGQAALWSSVEGAEDDAEAGAEAVAARGVTRKDVVAGIAASGRTPFVWGALHAAKALRAKTILVCFNPHLVISRAASPTLVIAPNVGPEILTGSTRLKAGTATKLLLNLFSTLAMVQLGKVIGNLMVDLNPSNTKLRDRAVRIVMELARAGRAEAERALEESGLVVKKAVARLKRNKRR